MSDDLQFDGILMSIIQQQQGIEGFFGTVFSFLRRNTDFFTNQKQAQQVIVTECQKQFDVYAAEKKKKLDEEAEKKKREEARRQKEAEAAGTEIQKSEQPSTTVQETKPAAASAPQVPAVSSKVASEPKIESTTQTSDAPAEQKKDDNQKPPIGNGGRTEKYIWTQTLEELQMFIYLPKHITQKDLTVQLENKKLYICIQGEAPLIDGEWPEKIHLDDSEWTIQDTFVQDYVGKHIHLVIAQWKNNWHWWDCAIQGDAQINTQQIQPESSRLDELDGETRSTVQQMMFDMRQKQMGLPSSDQLQKQEMLGGFMKSHPQMDFSKCKFN